MSEPPATRRKLGGGVAIRSLDDAEQRDNYSFSTRRDIALGLIRADIRDFVVHRTSGLPLQAIRLLRSYWAHRLDDARRALLSHEAAKLAYVDHIARG